MNCKCGNKWKIQDNLSAYTSEVVLVCTQCGSRYYNAQEFFSDDVLSKLKHLKIKGGRIY